MSACSPCGLSWDVLSYRYSYDIAFIDGALKWAFDRCNVDPARVSVGGLSDGASYALGLWSSTVGTRPPRR